MRITTSTVDEFVECLDNAVSIFENTIRVSITRRPQEGGRNAVKFDVVLQASALVTSPEGEYILEAGEECGIDYNDATQEKQGSSVASKQKQMIVEYAKTKNWKVLPGIISD